MNIKEIIKESLQTMNEGWDGNHLDESFGGLSMLEPIVGTDALKALLKKTGTSPDSSYEQVADYKSTVGLINTIKRITLKGNTGVSAILVSIGQNSFRIIRATNDIVADLKASNEYSYISTSGQISRLKLSDIIRNVESVYVFFGDPVKIAKKEQRLANKGIIDPYEPGAGENHYGKYGIKGNDTQFMSNAKKQLAKGVKEVGSINELVTLVSKIHTQTGERNLRRSFKFDGNFYTDIRIIDGSIHEALNNTGATVFTGYYNSTPESAREYEDGKFFRVVAKYSNGSLTFSLAYK